MSEDRVIVDRIQEAISNPGSVKINVKGAFIVDDEPEVRHGFDKDRDGVHFERKDIRLPHHTGAVSHVAVDVCVFCILFPNSQRFLNVILGDSIDRKFD